MEAFYYEISVRVECNSQIPLDSQILELLSARALELGVGGIEMLEGGFLVYVAGTTFDLQMFEDTLTEYCHCLQESFREYFQEDFERAFDLHIVAQKKKNEDWIQKYRESIKPIECGVFYIHPSWFLPIEGKVNLVIDPALAFGSGHHASTALCLEVLSRLATSGKDFLGRDFDLRNKRVLDVGCGSGILGLAVASYGALVWACDTDLLAVRETCKNIEANQLTFAKVWNGSLSDLPLLENRESFDIVIANILADVIIALPLAEYVRVSGLLILSGILEVYLAKVLMCFKNMHLVYKDTREEWCVLVLHKDS